MMFQRRKDIKQNVETKKELGISGGKGYLDNYNLIYQLNQRIKYLEDNCIKKWKVYYIIKNILHWE